MSQLILYIIIFIIFIAIRIVNSIKVPNNKRENTQQNRETYNDEDDILRRLSESLNEVDNNYKKENTIQEEKKETKKEESVEYNTDSENKYAKYNDYNYAISQANKNNINMERGYKENNYLLEQNNNTNYCRKKQLLRSLDIKNAIMYNAILEPKRLNYRLKRKK